MIAWLLCRLLGHDWSCPITIALPVDRHCRRCGRCERRRSIEAPWERLA